MSMINFKNGYGYLKIKTQRKGKLTLHLCINWRWKQHEEKPELAKWKHRELRNSSRDTSRKIMVSNLYSDSWKKEKPEKLPI